MAGASGWVAMLRPEAVVAEARAWIDTPYKHNHSAKGLGSDCLGLIVGVGRELGLGTERVVLPIYSSAWDEVQKDETMLRGFTEHLVRKEGTPRPGDVVVFRMFPDAVAKHCAIVSSSAHMIHAHQRNHVVEVTLGPWWRRRIVGVFSYPGVL